MLQWDWKAKASISIITLLLVFVIGWWLGHQTKTATIATSSEAPKKPLYWIDTMEPNVHYPGPGKSHMGMELVPVYADGNKDKSDHSIAISSAVENNLGVRIAPVTQGTLSRVFETVGYVQPNENNISHIHPYSDGWIRGLTIKYIGAQVKKGDVLFQFYSPNLISVEEEYLLALRSGEPNIIKASHQKLLAFNVSEKQIQNITQTKKADPLITIYAPQDGIVTKLSVREGMRVTPDTEVMELLDLSSVWIIADVFENQAAWVQVGQPAVAVLDTFPGKTWQGKVEYVYPEVDPTTRTVKVRLRFNNSDLTLKPNMFANIQLLVDPKPNALSIPQAALIPSSHGNYVVVSLDEGRYEPRKVITGIESGDRIEILSGLSVDEEVVTSGQFLLDSESNLKTGLDRLDSKDEQ